MTVKVNRCSLTAQAKYTWISLTRDKIEGKTDNETKQELKISALYAGQRLTSEDRVSGDVCKSVESGFASNLFCVPEI